jgi:hypothetical protein
LRRLRRTIVTHPRAMVTVLLALAVHLSPPPALVRHRHAGGDVAHIHGGRILGAAPAVVDIGAEARAPRMEHASSRGLHQHSVQPSMGGVAPFVVDPVSVLLVTPIVPDPASRELAAVERSGSVWSPPAHVV